MTVGDGCKKTPGWSTACTREEVEKKIEEFWGTRTCGSPEVWKLLRLACSANSSQEALEICRAGGLQLINGTLLCIQDLHSSLYELPPYLINPALEYGPPTTKNAETTHCPSIPLKLKLRSLRFNDLEYDCTTLTSGLEIKEFCASEQSLSRDKLRCFYGGKEVKDDSRLQQFSVKDNEIITVLSLA